MPEDGAVSQEGRVKRDKWAAWLAERRHGGDPEQRLRQLEGLAPVRDQVVANAALASGHRVLDVGCGDGLIAFAAAEAVGPSGLVIFSDISEDLLHHCQALAKEAGVFERCRFVNAPARDLSAIPDASVDAVTLRSVLIYESEKSAALAEFYRVLRPGGRLSLFEPINRFAFPEPPGRFTGYDVGAVAEPMAKVKAVFAAIQPPGVDPMLDFDERDLLRLTEDVGFEEVHLQLRVEIRQAVPIPWARFVNSSGNPRIPTLTEAMADALTPAESDRVVAHLQPLVEQGRGQWRTATTYLWAVR